MLVNESSTTNSILVIKNDTPGNYLRGPYKHLGCMQRKWLITLHLRSVLRSLGPQTFFPFGSSSLFSSLCNLNLFVHPIEANNRSAVLSSSQIYKYTPKWPLFLKEDGGILLTLHVHSHRSDVNEVHGPWCPAEARFKLLP